MGDLSTGLKTEPGGARPLAEVSLSENQISRTANWVRPERDQNARWILGKVSQWEASSRRTAHAFGEIA